MASPMAKRAAAARSRSGAASTASSSSSSSSSSCGDGCGHSHGLGNPALPEAALNQAPESELSPEDQGFRKACLWLMTSSSSGLRPVDAVIEGRRFQCFKGRHLARAVMPAAALTAANSSVKTEGKGMDVQVDGEKKEKEKDSKKNKSSKAQDADAEGDAESAAFLAKFPELACNTPAEVEAFGQRMMDAGYAFRVVKLPQKWRRRGDPLKVAPAGDDNEDEEPRFEAAPHTLYAWSLRPSQTRNVVIGVLLALVSIGITLIKLWPLWLKLVVWWISLIYIVACVGLLSIRVIVFGFFWLIGLRGVWILPNLLSDDHDFLELWSPLVSWPGRANRRRTTTVTVTVKNSDGTETTKTVVQPVESPSWKFGALNMLGVVLLIIWGCREMGLFDVELIPEAWLSPQDIFAVYPSLAPPGYTPPPTETASDAPTPADVGEEDSDAGSAWETVIEGEGEDEDDDEEVEDLEDDAEDVDDDHEQGDEAEDDKDAAAGKRKEL